jgi:pantetheine-phosphate adenylyltransferase
MKLAIYPGSFDPPTYGHLNIMERGAKLVDRLLVVVFQNPSKHGMFTLDERYDMLKKITKNIPNVEVDVCEGLLNEYARKKHCHLLIRGIRFYTDFDYEFQRALLLKKTKPHLETAFFMTDGKYSYVSSSAVRELAQFGGDIHQMVPPYVEKKIKEKFNNLSK